jgi:multisubunit Na+/H+ antiporter MnhB subunit
MGYARFAGMIATSTVVMFGLMYLNTYALSHIEFSQTRMWMALVMGAVMALIMIGFMWGMYKTPARTSASSRQQYWSLAVRSGWSARRRRWTMLPG